jgi:hypothetical protein
MCARFHYNCDIKNGGLVPYATRPVSFLFVVSYISTTTNASNASIPMEISRSNK